MSAYTDDPALVGVHRFQAASLGLVPFRFAGLFCLLPAAFTGFYGKVCQRYSQRRTLGKCKPAARRFEVSNQRQG